MAKINGNKKTKEAVETTAANNKKSIAKLVVDLIKTVDDNSEAGKILAKGLINTGDRKLITKASRKVDGNSEVGKILKVDVAVHRIQGKIRTCIDFPEALKSKMENDKPLVVPQIQKIKQRNQKSPKPVPDTELRNTLYDKTKHSRVVEILYRQHKHGLYLLLSKSPDAAKDLVSETFLKFAKKAKENKIPQKMYFNSYLAKMLRNIFIDSLRIKKRSGQHVHLEKYHFENFGEDDNYEIEQLDIFDEIGRAHV